jgi:hypothetical protein
MAVEVKIIAGIDAAREQMESRDYQRRKEESEPGTIPFFLSI